MRPHRRWLVTGVGAGLYFSFTFAWNGLAALMPNILTDLQLSSLSTGILLSTVAGVITLTWILMGPAVDRIGPTAAMSLGVFAIGLAAISRFFASGFTGLFIAMVIIALGGSTVTYGLPRAISSWFPTEQAGTPLGLVTVGAQLGTIAAFSSMQLFVTWFGGWRPALLLSGIPALVFASLWFWLGDRGSYFEPSDPPGLSTIWTYLRRPTVLALIIAGATYLFATHSVFGWLATLFVRRGFENGTATQLVAVLTVGQLLGTVSMPLVSDRSTHRTAYIVLAGVMFSIAIVGFRLWALNVVIFGLGCLLVGIAIGGISPLLRVLPLELVPQGSVSTVVSMVFGLGALGGFLGPVLVGAALSQVSLTGAFVVLALPGPALIFVGLFFASINKD